MELNEHQKTIFLDRYAKRDKDGNTVETDPEQMWARVAREIADDVDEREAFYAILSGFRFVPGGRILAGAGTESEKTFYNCFVIPVETRARRINRANRGYGVQEFEHDPGSDSREAIFDTTATMVDIMSRGGGVGINWSVLRPSGSYLTRISGTSSGPVGWMDVASKAVGEVIQGGSRRGAAMFMLNDWHPDVLKFIEAKTEAGKIENANISVAVSDEFMRCVQDKKPWVFKFPDTTNPHYNYEWDGDLADWMAKGYPVVEYGSVPAAELWAKLANAAWRSGEPGVVFIDRYNERSTAKGVEKIISVNPCGEQGLGAYSVCNLGSMNLAAYVRDDGVFMWDRFERDVRVAVTFLDNVIDKTHYMHEDSKRAQMSLRRIGLGVMGLADSLIMLGMRYGSPRAIEFTERVFATMKDAAIKQSMMLAAERGPAGAWNDKMWERPYLAEFAKRHEGYKLTPLRNLFLLTQAPTGTTSALAGVNSGIEPYFAFVYTRKDRTGTHKIDADIVKKARDYRALVTTGDLGVYEHLLMQAAAQKYIDSSISKTINAPNDASEASVLEAYTMAYALGLKGLAYYRDGSRSKQVLYAEDPNKKIADLEAKIEFLQKQIKNARLLPQTPIGGHPMITFDKPAMPVLAFAPQSDACPVCTGAIIFAEGCQKCSSCTWSAC